MDKYEIISKIESFAPPQTAQEWDCCGFAIETKKSDISKIMLCLTPCDNVIAQAMALNCDMIISHHPMFKIDCKSVFLTEFYSPKIDIYCAHTNMDLAQGGTTDTLVEALNLDIESIASFEFVRFVELKQSVSIDAFTKILRRVSPNLRYTNNNEQKTVKKIGFCAGSGSEFIPLAQDYGADCFVTGDLKFHTALESKIVVYDIGHFESEILILPKIKELIPSGVEVVFAKERSPFLI